ncbi:Acp36DE [Drosophila sechellia]|uniref:Acp36DE n=1 Tax=Drosophila sechellia TaxID=7238 RepID=B4I5G5_DROSE|nr:Acp36DE [Drosophila sechellia]
MWTLTCQQFIALMLLGTLVPSESFLCKHCFRKNIEKVHESFRDILSPPIFGVNPQPLIEVQQPKATPKPESSQVIHVHQPQVILKPIYYPKVDTISTKNQIGIHGSLSPYRQYPSLSSANLLGLPNQQLLSPQELLSDKVQKQAQVQNNNLHIRLGVTGLREGRNNPSLETIPRDRVDKISPELQLQLLRYADSQSQSQSQSASQSESNASSQSQAQVQNNRLLENPTVSESQGQQIQSQLQKNQLDKQFASQFKSQSKSQLEQQIQLHLQSLRELQQKELDEQYAPQSKSQLQVAEQMQSLLQLLRFLNSRLKTPSALKSDLENQILLQLRKLRLVQLKQLAEQPTVRPSSKSQSPGQLEQQILLQLLNLLQFQQNQLKSDAQAQSQLQESKSNSLSQSQSQSQSQEQLQLQRDQNLRQLEQIKLEMKNIRQLLQKGKSELQTQSDSQRQIHELYQNILQLNKEKLSYQLKQLKLKELEDQKKSQAEISKGSNPSNLYIIGQLPSEGKPAPGPQGATLESQVNQPKLVSQPGLLAKLPSGGGLIGKPASTGLYILSPDINELSNYRDQLRLQQELRKHQQLLSLLQRRQNDLKTEQNAQLLLGQQQKEQQAQESINKQQSSSGASSSQTKLQQDIQSAGSQGSQQGLQAGSTGLQTSSLQGTDSSASQSAALQRLKEQEQLRIQTETDQKTSSSSSQSNSQNSQSSSSQTSQASQSGAQRQEADNRNTLLLDQSSSKTQSESKSESSSQSSSHSSSQSTSNSSSSVQSKLQGERHDALLNNLSG